jgi:hypothetical protein
MTPYLAGLVNDAIAELKIPGRIRRVAGVGSGFGDVPPQRLESVSTSHLSSLSNETRPPAQIAKPEQF